MPWYKRRTFQIPAAIITTAAVVGAVVGVTVWQTGFAPNSHQDPDVCSLVNDFWPAVVDQSAMVFSSVTESLTSKFTLGTMLSLWQATCGRFNASTGCYPENDVVRQRKLLQVADVINTNSLTGGVACDVFPVQKGSFSCFWGSLRLSAENHVKR